MSEEFEAMKAAALEYRASFEELRETQEASNSAATIHMRAVERNRKAEFALHEAERRWIASLERA